MSASVDVLPHRPSLLDRRASSNYTDLPDRLAVSALFAPAAPSAARPAAAAAARGASRKHSAALLPFVPLTPIMASPLLTPEIAHAPTPAAVLEGAARQATSGHDPPPRQDYLSHHVSPPHPTWMTSPPTPPPKLSSSPRAIPSPGASAARVARGRSKSHSKSSRSRSTSTHRSGPRPASLASYTPTPLSRSYSPSPSLHAAGPNPPVTRPTARRLSLPADLSKPLPPRPPPTDDGAPEEMPPVPSKGGSAVIDDADAAANAGALLPSLSRRAGGAHVGVPPAPGAGETSTGRGRARKLFSLDDDEGDASDSEERGRDALAGQKRGVRKESAPRAQMAEESSADQEHEQQRAERVRRYHALMELLTTEVGYLLDLRTLVTVYLDQLLLLSSPSQISVVPALPTSLGPSGLPTPPLAQPLCLGVPHPSSGRSISSLSALSIPSIFPSSRSSFLHNSPGPSPSPSTVNIVSIASPDQEGEDGSSGDRTRQSSGVSTFTESLLGDRDREHEKENLERIQPPPLKPSKSSRLPPTVLAEKEVRAVYRNARELLLFHEQFVGELRAAVGLVGVGMMFNGDEGWIGDMHGDGESVVADLVEHAVEIVAAKFTSEAASFSIYETFCPGHAAATDLLRRAQERWPAIWDAYEQRCALLSARSPEQPPHPHHRGLSDNTVAAASSASPAAEADMAADGPMRKKRRHSTPTLSLASQPASPTRLPFPSASSPGAAAPRPPVSATSSTGDRRPRAAGPKLKFQDYLIKPVQRICKYPLLLDQLRPKRRDAAASVQQAAADEAVRRAGEAMRRVVSRVNRASEKEAHNLRSALIASRIAFVHSPAPPVPSPPAQSAPSAYPTPPPTTPSSSSGSSSSHGHGSTSTAPSSVGSCTSSAAVSSPAAVASLPPLAVPLPRPGGLTAEFVSSLGPCMLAGALDVIQHPAHRAKYLGAFLYAGGYCVLVKITKGGRVYEPRHWFPFSAVEVVDVEEDDPSFPYSFHVTAQGRHLQLGAACAQEKAFWLSAINDSLKAKPQCWVNEPLSSFQADEKAPLSAADDVPPQDSPNGLPAIQSLSDLEKQAGGSGSPPPMDASPTPTSKGQLKYSRTLSRLDGAALRQDSHPPVSTISAALSRRSSTASVKAFFTPFDSARTTRPSSQVRAQVEQGLHDIFSESCLAARSQAQMRGEDLFSVRVPPSGGGGMGVGKRQGSGIPRSNSGISIANAMGLTAAKRRYDSVLVSRRKASMEGVPDLPVSGESVSGSPSAEMNAAGSAGAGRAKTLAVRRQKKQPASIAPAISSAIAQFSEEAERRGPLVRSPEALSLDSPPAASHSSTSSHPPSMLPSPTEAASLPIPVPGLSPNGTLRQSDILQAHARGEDARPIPKRSRSMVSHVRNIFHHRREDSPSALPSPSTSDHSLISAAPPQLPPLLLGSPTSEYPSGIVQWLRRTSLRRRDSSNSSTHSTEDNEQSSRRPPLPTRSSTDGVTGRGSGQGDEPSLLISQSPRRVAFHDAPPKRRRSLFVPSARSRDRAPAARDDGPRAHAHAELPSPASTSIPARKSIKNIFLFQRSHSLTPLR